MFRNLGAIADAPPHAGWGDGRDACVDTLSSLELLILLALLLRALLLVVLRILAALLILLLALLVILSLVLLFLVHCTPRL